MGFRTEVTPDLLVRDASLAERALRENAIQTDRLRTRLPRHRDLLRQIVQQGLQPV
jgi:tryptophan halogenase